MLASGLFSTPGQGMRNFEGAFVAATQVMLILYVCMSVTYMARERC